ncbi:YlmC/YmxH family sporulation protein [Viridibacillus sp. YIM B01967]|uniref:YlmC/YmxH family sporulation protein n=1 Tax=Viridibacillus soli TaxID=2798301 RepID=A0ABS1H4W9_9BACL|nr:YlmC/YmxH family sporulation protein [Viridibacillus soli]MBK3494470.1 YlmC/YmxH family sporulation protein [Viridibacillus soli]
MRFSDIQRKEIIEAGNGRFLGFVLDAVLSEETGFIKAFVVSEPKRFFQFSQNDKDALNIRIEDILVIGKDVILVKANQ